jgi:hypothetical protein
MATMGKSGLGAQRRERLKALREAALHRPVLARHLSDGFNGRWSRRQWAQASLVATLGMLVAAIVPGFSPVQDAPLRPPACPWRCRCLPCRSRACRDRPVTAGNWCVWNAARLWPPLFKQFGISPSTLHEVMQQPGAREALTRLKPGTELAFDLPVGEGGTGSELRALRFDRDASHRVEMSFVGGEIRQNVIDRPSETRTVVLSGKVGRSLYGSARKLGLTGSNINTLTDDIFKYDIDFNDDVAASDRFSVVVEQTWREGELISTGPVLAATFTTATSCTPASGSCATARPSTSPATAAR